jgi:hypothetical protein
MKTVRARTLVAVLMITLLSGNLLAFAPKAVAPATREMGLLRLLREPAVQERLRMTPAQAEMVYVAEQQVERMMAQLEADMEEALGSLDPTHPNIGNYIREWTERLIRKRGELEAEFVRRILTPPQVEMLKRMLR